MAELLRGEHVELAEIADEAEIFAEEVGDIEFITKGARSLLETALTSQTRRTSSTRTLTRRVAMKRARMTTRRASGRWRVCVACVRAAWPA